MATRTYRAGSMREALAQVRRDLGGQAVILGTREVRRRRAFGLGTRELIEVTASDAAESSRPIVIKAPAVMPAAARVAPAPETPKHERFDDRLGAIHAAVSSLSRSGRIEHLLPDLPSELVPTYSALLEADIPETLARRLVRYVTDNLEPGDLHRPGRVRGTLIEAIETCVPVAPPIAPIAGTRRIIALVGPTGVGKTTTVAKLAANFKLAQGFRPGLITVDTYRIAAVAQLRTYAEIIDLPLAVASAPEEMPKAIAELGDVDIVLIDTAGRSPRDEVRIRELADFLEAARPDETHLVLSAVAGERALRSAVERFSPVHTDRLIFTKLDEAEGLGAVLAILGQVDRPVSYITTGQSVPDDIEPADRARLARLILGEELVT